MARMTRTYRHNTLTAPGKRRCWICGTWMEMVQGQNHCGDDDCTIANLVERVEARRQERLAR